MTVSSLITPVAVHIILSIWGKGKKFTNQLESLEQSAASLFIPVSWKFSYYLPKERAKIQNSSWEVQILKIAVTPRIDLKTLSLIPHPRMSLTEYFIDYMNVCSMIISDQISNQNVASLNKFVVPQRWRRVESSTFL